MYSETDTVILNRMKNNVPSDIDTSEGSFIHDSFSPVSQEIAQQEINLDELIKRTFAITAAENGYSTELENRCVEHGITRKQGTNAIGQVTFTGTANTLIPKGTIVQTAGVLQYQTVNDVVISDTTITVNIEAMAVGIKYNVPANTIVQLPVQIEGIISVTNLNPITSGTDIEDNSNLLERYLLKVRKPSTSGNKNDYKRWATEIDGVGNAKVTALWNGNGTVKVTIINANKRAANNELIQKVKDYIDPEPSGKGEGQAPIGAICTVVSAVEKNINITASVILANGYTLQQVQDNCTAAIKKYLSDLAFNSTYVSYARLGNILLTTEGIVDYNNLTIGNGTVNISLSDEEIPVLGTLNLGV